MISMTKFNELSEHEVLEIIECLMEICARKEAEIAELKAQLDIFKPKEARLKFFEESASGIRGDILLVFQSANLRDIIKGLFEKSKIYNVAAVEGYEGILPYCATYHPDIGVFELSRIINTESQLTIMKEMKAMTKGFKLITILPENDVRLISDVVTAGSDDFLVKPIDMNRLLNVINDIVNRKREKVAV